MQKLVIIMVVFLVTSAASAMSGDRQTLLQELKQKRDATAKTYQELGEELARLNRVGDQGFPIMADIRRDLLDAQNAYRQDLMSYKNLIRMVESLPPPDVIEILREKPAKNIDFQAVFHEIYQQYRNKPTENSSAIEEMATRQKVRDYYEDLKNVLDQKLAIIRNYKNKKVDIAIADAQRNKDKNLSNILVGFANKAKKRETELAKRQKSCGRIIDLIKYLPPPGQNRTIEQPSNEVIDIIDDLWEKHDIPRERF